MSDLIPRYPGAKSNRRKYPVWDGQTYDLAIVPFAGSGRWCIPALQQGHVKALAVADADPAVRAVWEQFVYAADHAFFNECLECWLQDFSCVNEDGAVELFKKLCWIHDNPHAAADSDDTPYDIFDYVAAKILLHKLCFGGNVRSNAQGKLNISLRKDWVNALFGDGEPEHWWDYELPYCPASASVQIFDDWPKAWSAIQPGQKTICFLDPPYYAPGNSPRVKGGMSKAYAVHGGNPNDGSVLDMFKGAVRAAIAAGCDRIVATNYWGHYLQTIEYPALPEALIAEMPKDSDYEWIAITELGKSIEPKIIGQQWIEYEETTEFMRSMGFEWFHDLGPLQSMNNINFNPSKAGTTEQRTVRHEGWWEMGGNRQHGRVQQMNLLEAVA